MKTIKSILTDAALMAGLVTIAITLGMLVIWALQVSHLVTH